VSGAAAPAAAQTGFEAPDYDGSADGVLVTGQQGWYLPPVDGSTDEFVYTYVDNALGLPANAVGEDQFLGGVVSRDGLLDRAQFDFDWSAASVWTASYDFAARFNGTLPASDNLGSFSLQNSLVARYFIALNTWVNILTAEQWNAQYIAFNASGVMMDPMSPGPEWRNLSVDHWYRQSTTFDFDSNSITSVSITDLDTGDTATMAPTGWYLAGGAGGSGLPLPTGLRFFIGGDLTTLGNTQGWDNLAMDPGAAPAAPGREESRGAQSMPLASGSVTN